MYSTRGNPNHYQLYIFYMIYYMSNITISHFLKSSCVPPQRRAAVPMIQKVSSRATLPKDSVVTTARQCLIIQHYPFQLLVYFLKTF